MTDSARATTHLHRAARGYRSTLLSQAIRVMCKVAGVVVLARLVSPADHGRYAMAASLFFVLILFRDWGLGTAAIQTSTLTEGQCTAIWRAHFLIGLVLAAASLFAAPVLAAFYRDSAVTGLVALMSAGFVLIGINAWPRVLLTRDLRIEELNRVETWAAVIGTVAMIGAAGLGAGAYAFVVFLLVSEGLIAITGWRVCGWRPVAPAAWGELRALWSTGSHVTGYSVLVALVQQLDAILMGRWFGAAALGLYNRPGQMLALANQHLTLPFTQVFTSALSRTRDDEPEFRRHVMTTANMIAHLTLPLAVVCVALPDEVVRIVLGSAWPAAAPLLRWLAVGAAFSYLATPIYGLCVAAKNTRRLAAMAVVMLVALAAALVLGRRFGPIGLAAAVATTNAVLLVPRLLWAASGTPVRLGDFVRAYAGPVVLGLTLGAGLYLGRELSPNSGFAIRFASAAAVGAVAVGLCLGLSRSLRAELGYIRAHLPGSSDSPSPVCAEAPLP